MKRLLNYGIDLLQLLLLDVMLLIAFYNVFDVGDGVFDHSGHDVNRAQMVHLRSLEHLRLFRVAIFFHDFQISQV